MLEKTYQPSGIEADIYRRWEEAGAFACGRPDRLARDAESYCIVIPPPNVTGSLHMGHALNNTLQDVLVRFERMRGKDVLWQPGTDHAGIATQMVVERQLMEHQQPGRREMGRDAFVERVWEWKAESGGTILNQLKRLGASCDWARERFTMDEGLSRAVLKVFVDLYREKLIYKDKRLVNWDPKLETAISDLEVQQVETKGHLWHLRYPIEGEEGRFIVVATTRPETMLGDTGVAVHPDDERYQDLIGKHALLPLVGRRLQIVADLHADPEQGSGAVKITPAHDFNDFEVGRRHDLEMINIFDRHACINDNAPETYRGLDRFEARKRVVADLEAQDLLERIEDHTHVVPYGDRSNVVIEPYLTEQWYVDAATLAKPAIAAVEQGDTVFVPKTWEKTYFEWMRNIQPWCISRQLWWGHQIPAWYGLSMQKPLDHPNLNEEAIFVGLTEDDVRREAEEYYGRPVEFHASFEQYAEAKQQFVIDYRADPGPAPLYRDPDVLDTWFSSALWPFSTLGWPDETPELARYYKTDVLVTAFDIIFFWVARMMMMGLHFRDEVPFHTVYIHALVRDEKGQKMSKSKGNVIDPLELIDAYGADALRFTLAAMAAQGRDIKLAKSRVEGYRNFGTKLWNAARFLEMNECVTRPDFDPRSPELTVNRWIAGKVEKAAAAVTEGIASYRFNEAAGAVYQFVWRIYCDWYLELIKPLLQGDDEAAKAETRATAAWALDQALKLLHPFTPFITEELWQRLGERAGGRDEMLILSEWPELDGLSDEWAAQELGWEIRFVSEVRSVRSEMNVPAGALVPVVISGADPGTRANAEGYDDTLKRLARIEEIDFADEPPKGTVQIVLGEATVALRLEGIIDIAEETARLQREIAKVGSEIEKLSAKLSNEQFVSRAPEHVVEEQRERKADAEAAEARLKEALKRIEVAL